MPKNKYNIGDIVYYVSKSNKGEITVIKGIVDAIEITARYIKYIVVHNIVYSLYVSEEYLYDNVTNVMDKVYQLLK